jgi:glycosyltransferase involved in cell wall biosynthesis
MTIKISVVIATRNRAKYLEKAIKSLVNQSLDPTKYEIIIVDNASEDETKQVVEAFASLKNLRYITEPVVGLSKARNAGWKSALGEYIALLDDDAVADAKWLEKYLEAFEEFGEAVGLIGGKVELIWEYPQPVWLPTELLGFFSFYRYADKPIILENKQWLSACNLAFPRKVIYAVGGFREDLGREGDRLRAGGEEYLRRQVDKRGLQSIYHPDIVVHHHVSSNKLTKRWFRNAAYWQGKSEATMLDSSEKPLVLAEKTKLISRRILWITPRIGAMIIATNPARRFRRWFQVVETMGFLLGLFSNN